MLYGHEAIRELLPQISAQSLLFTGPERVGKRRVARWYAQYLNCESPGQEACGHCRSCLLFAQVHPDYRELAPKQETRAGRASRRPQIRIDALVARPQGDDNPLSRWLESRPHFKRRVAVIDQADTLNDQAANAFLKMLEEPPSYSTIILLAPSPQALLPTIASRCLTIRFATLDLSHFEGAAEHPAARLGRVGDILEVRAHAEHFAELKALLESYVESLSSSLELALEQADALEKRWLSETMFDLPDLLRAMLSQRQPDHYAKALDAIARCEEALASYASSSIAVQVLTLELRQSLGRAAS